jgi:hypothetical protein
MRKLSGVLAVVGLPAPWRGQVSRGRKAAVGAAVTALCVFALTVGPIASPAGERGGRPDQNDKIKRQLVGTWKLRNYVLVNSNGEVVLHLAGRRPIGKLTYTSSGHMWAHASRRDRGPTDLWYTGTFSVNARGGTVTHHVESGLNRNLDGSDQVRRYRLRRNTLVLWVDAGRGQRVELTWLRTARS